MKDKKYIGIYYPNCYIENQVSLTTFALFFDELHLITISDFANDPTNYLKQLPKSININVIGSPSNDEIERTKNFYQFALNNQELLGQILFFHPHLLDSSVTSFSSKLLSGKLTQDEFLNFFIGETPEKKVYEEFVKKFPNIKDEFALRSSPTAIKLAEENDWILVSDNPELPVPYLSDKSKTVRYLTTILAEECIRINLPQSISLNADDILLAREKLKEQLVPFRMSMQKLSSTLKSAIKDIKNIDEIKVEAKFIAESQVEPAIYELRRKIEIEKDKLWIKIFGKVISWIPLVAKGFAMPTPDNIFEAMEKVYGDVGTLAENIQNIDIAKEAGMCYLLKLDEIIKDK
jgi:hypothetical protein